MTRARRWWLLAVAAVWIIGTALIGLAYLVGSARPRVDVSDAPEGGPVIVRGRVEAARTTVSPSGIECAGWVATSTALSPHQIPMVVCSNMNVSGIVVTDGKSRLHIDESFFEKSEGGGLWVVNVHGFPGGSSTPAATYLARCGDLAKGASYAEQVIPVGVQVEISGCRVSDRIVPCEDGNDELTTTHADRHSILEQRRHDLSVTLIRLGIFTVLVVALGGLLSRRQAPLH